MPPSQVYDPRSLSAFYRCCRKVRLLAARSNAFELVVCFDLVHLGVSHVWGLGSGSGPLVKAWVWVFSSGSGLDSVVVSFGLVRFDVLS